MNPKMKLVVAAGLILAPLSVAHAADAPCVVSKTNDCGTSYLDVSPKADGSAAVLTIHVPGRNDVSIDYAPDRLATIVTQIDKTKQDIVKIQAAKAEEARVAREQAEQAKSETGGDSNQTMIAALLIGAVVILALMAPAFTRRRATA